MILKTSTIFYRFIIAILLTGLFAITGCEEDCPEVVVDDLNAFFFQFKTSGDNAFDPSELDSIFIIRYSDVLPDSFSFPVDTVDFYNGVLSFDEYVIRLSQGQPFADIPPPYFPDYKYRILSNDQDFEFRIEQIDLVGSYIGECEYVNSKKSIVFEGDTLDFIAGEDEIIVMEKP